MGSMKVCIVGAGAIGGFLGARLAANTDSVMSAVARGDTAQALRRYGFRLAQGDQSLSGPVTVSESPADLGPQDLVILSVKAPSLPGLAARLDPLVGPETILLSTLNGIPWWFFHKFGGPLQGSRVQAVDPDGIVSKHLPPAQVLGCVVHATCSVQEPGLVRHGLGETLIIGDPAGGVSQRAEIVAALLGRAGFEAPLSSRIQADIWLKLWGNMTMNPISALTGATCDRILDDPLVNRFCLSIMDEAARIGTMIGCPISLSGEERNAMTRRLGAFKTSMLQDSEAGRPLEIDGLLGSVREIANRLKFETPHLDNLLGLIRLMGRVRGLYA